MDVISDANGITIRKFLSKKFIPYSDLQSVVINDAGINFTTRDGALTTVANRILYELGALYKEIHNNRFYYKDEVEISTCQDLYCIEDIQAKIPGIIEYVHAQMIDTIHSKYGDEYDIVITDSTVDEYIQLDLCLTKNDKAVQFFEAFDDIALAYLLEWDPGQGCGRYGVTVEFTDRDALKSSIDDTLQYLSEHYKPKK
ncbi:MAG: hypothetical protein IK115_01080 [Lachnospiraceae bacterium]|nr:hypothetical protein [Lachnospiraceae bacterium]